MRACVVASAKGYRFRPVCIAVHTSEKEEVSVPSWCEQWANLVDVNEIKWASSVWNEASVVRWTIAFWHWIQNRVHCLMSALMPGHTERDVTSFRCSRCSSGVVVAIKTSSIYTYANIICWITLSMNFGMSVLHFIGERAFVGIRKGQRGLWQWFYGCRMGWWVSYDKVQLWNDGGTFQGSQEVIYVWYWG